MSDVRKQPTLHDVARLAGFSTSTTARALGNYGRIAETTREKVRAAAEELGYRANPLARSMITGKTKTIGVVCADLSSPFFAEALRGISDVAKGRGYDILIVNTDEDVASERDAVALLRDRHVDGVIVSPADVRQVDHLAALQTPERALVLLDRSSSALDADSVTVDDVSAMTDAVGRLLDAGHRHIGIVTELRIEREADWQSLLGDLDHSERRELNPSSRRLLGYLRAHREHDIPIDPALVARTGATSVDSARRATTRLLEQRDETGMTAVVTVDNTTSVGAYGAIRDHGLRVPDDLSFIAFDNLDWTTLVQPAVSVIEQPVYALGSRAADVLLDRLDGTRTSPGEEILLDTRFIERESIRAVQQV